MIIELIVLEKRLKLISEKLDNLTNKVDSNEEILNGLVNLSIGNPPDTVPEFDAVKNDPNSICNNYSSASIQEFKSIRDENVSESHSNGDTTAVSLNPIRFCLYKYIYIWEKNGRSYWAYLFHASDKTIYGFKWIVNSWMYFSLPLNKIDSFVYC